MWEFCFDGWDVVDWDFDGLLVLYVIFIVSDVFEKMIYYCGLVGMYVVMIEVLVCWVEMVIGDLNVGEGFGFVVVGYGIECNENFVKVIEYYVDCICEMDCFDEV